MFWQFFAQMEYGGLVKPLGGLFATEHVREAHLMYVGKKPKIELNAISFHII
jgi:hypothetical protein